MSYSHLSRSGYVYCVRRAGTTYYKIASAPAGDLTSHLMGLGQTEENPTALTLLGWVEVRDHEAAAQTLRDAFHLYQVNSDWFNFRVDRSTRLKSLLGFYADLAVQLPVTERLIDQEAQPQYDRTFGFFEAIHQANQLGYFPENKQEIPVFPIPEKKGGLQPIVVDRVKRWGQRFRDRPAWIYGPGVAVLGLLGILHFKGQYSSQSMNYIAPAATTAPESKPEASKNEATKLETSKPEVPKTEAAKPESLKSENSKSDLSKAEANQANPTKSEVSKPEASKSENAKPESTKSEGTKSESTKSEAKKNTTSKPEIPQEAVAKSAPNPPAESVPPQESGSMVWSRSSEGARLRAYPGNPADGGNEIDFIPNGTPIILGETSGAWQEVILPDGRRGWVFNDLIKE